MAIELIDIEFDEKDTTPERLIKATQALLAVYGYDATTTRMISNLAKVNLSAIGFHFGNKENLVKEAVTRAAEKLEEHYKKISLEVYEFLQQQPVDKEKAWHYIDRLLVDRIRRAFDYNSSWINVGLTQNENGFPESSKGIMAQAAIRHNEQVLAELILAVSNKKDVFKAAMIARNINSVIIGYTEKPILNRLLGEAMGTDLNDQRKMEEYLHAYFMECIETAVKI